ncbi:hypothetical protein [Lysinibacter sp. HNR]|uniref:glycosyltransferase n=1 Tax=Lysinibacter sp. HNR TaxID=3031408 RepID=UPI002434E0C2|nr:hypothetical protein [Lysinibacter sp. HNR]WGD38056.1 hypothetical protein FrondiHNR_03825 [Lysinibacter sp. HNR]
MTTLTIVAEGLWPSASIDLSDHIHDVSRSLVATTPKNCQVELILPKGLNAEISFYESFCPQASVILLPRDRAATARSWSVGITGGAHEGLVHAPSMLAPLRRHDGVNDGVQTTVSISDTTPWTHPDSCSPGLSLWFKGMIKRALKHADAVVVPSHTVAENLSQYANFGDRVRVIGESAPTRVVNASTSDKNPITPDLPVDYIVAYGNLGSASDLSTIVRALTRPELAELSLVVVSDSAIDTTKFTALLEQHTVDQTRVRLLQSSPGEQVRTAFSGAKAYVSPGTSDRYDSQILTAFSLGTPVIHSSSALHTELADGAGVAVDATLNSDDYVDAYATEIARVVGDSTVRDRLSTLGTDRAKAFTWRETGERIWQLHAEL